MLQRAHLAEHADPRGRGGRQAPHGGDEHVAPSEVVGCKLRRDATPTPCQARTDDRHAGGRASDYTQHVGEQACQSQPDQHDRDRQALGAVARRARGGRQAGPDHADHDRDHRQVLFAPRVLVKHPLSEEHQDKQARRERRLHDDQRGQQQRDELQRPAEDRQAGAEQPTGPAHQAPYEREAQMLAAWRLLGVHRLEGDP